MRTENFHFLTEYDFRDNTTGAISYGDGITANTFFVENGKATLNVDSSTYGWFIHRVTDLKVGDVIEVSCEMKSLSGTLPRMQINKGGFNTPTTEIMLQLKSPEWQVVQAKYIVEEDNVYYMAVGFGTPDSGKALFRNFHTTVKTNSKPLEIQNISADSTKQLTAYRTKQFEFFNTSGDTGTRERVTVDINNVYGGFVGDVIKVVKASYDVSIKIGGGNILGSVLNEASEYRVYELLKISRGNWMILNP